MRSGAESLKRTKPTKRPLQAIDPDPPPTSKHCRLKPPPTPSPTALPTYIQPYKRRPSHKQPSKASRPLKRVCEEPDSEPANKRKVLNWLSTIESVTAPPEVTSSKTFGTVGEPSSPHTSSHTLQAVMDRISQKEGQNSGASSIGSSQSEIPSTSNPIFRSVLSRNHVTIDPSGREMSPEVRGLVETHILKRRLSPRPEDEDKSKVVDQVLKVWDKSEPTVSDIIESLAFPVDRRGIAEGHNTQWSTKPMPRNANSDWTDTEIAAADHHAARPYTQPTEENILPFFVVEVKSEATGTAWAGRSLDEAD
ncbi:uncharacterized protein FOMMEDRAFT_150852 [Fomitiporia mediterranea MF3/22]|uniref:uncharacterized protein n=1 Tax=Fomitiporia mediterranea (strain MF3/22) TaxID=694068 RepID=UPI0004408AEE|nr:uncharacterized protein FOMMEDRAFT_150852 [Fomitiporia mediterranea MF3/22]EJD08158.1 hypothetical protein FOMMEDRAFT_150852 [Fomitiporia mediterranea MF3/22]